jgi:hypothetical protein
VSLDDPEELGEELLLELGEELLPPLDWSLEELEPGVLDEPLEELGLELELDPDELGLDGELDMEPEPELDPGEVLEPEDEPDCDAPLDDFEPPPELPPRSQP